MRKVVKFIGASIIRNLIRSVYILYQSLIQNHINQRKNGLLQKHTFKFYEIPPQLWSLKKILLTVNNFNFMGPFSFKKYLKDFFDAKDGDVEVFLHKCHNITHSI